jgi:hypothetical protein
MCLKKSTRVNLVLQFFTHPAFSRLIPKLKQNRPKCEAFIDEVVKKYKPHGLLVTLIKKYRLQVVTVLTGVYSLEKEKDLEGKQF